MGSKWCGHDRGCEELTSGGGFRTTFVLVVEYGTCFLTSSSFRKNDRSTSHELVQKSRSKLLVRNPPKKSHMRFFVDSPNENLIRVAVIFMNVRFDVNSRRLSVLVASTGAY